jgi:hypothetical protein
MQGNQLQLDIVSEQPEGATFVNTNKSLTPPNSILLARGYAFVNQHSLESVYLNTFQVPFAVKEGTWYRITSVVTPDSLSVSINGTLALNTTVLGTYAGGYGPNPPFGFGAWQDQAAWVRNVRATTSNGSYTYSNAMTSPDVIADYGVGAMPESACLDGAKRDRLVWLGDYYHTSRIIGVSTSRFDLAQGTLNFVLATQGSDGTLAFSPQIGTELSKQPTGAGGLLDYELLGIGAFYSYVQQTNDLDWVRGTWAKWQRLGAWLLGRISADNGLLNLASAFTGPGSGGSAVSCLGVQSLRQLASVATSIGDDSLASTYAAAAANMTQAINKILWNDDLGIYSLAATNKSDYSVAGTGFCISAGVASAAQASRAIDALKALSLGPGFKDDTTKDSGSADTIISPNMNGFVLPALFAANRSAEGASLVRSLWGAMASNSQYTSGASWEYVDQQGGPGLGPFTSLAHPWGGAATYVLTEWVAGVRAAEGVAGFGYKSWVVDPSQGVAIGLKRASARVVVPGGALESAWSVSGNEISVTVSAPANTTGVVLFGGASFALVPDMSSDDTVTAAVDGPEARYQVVLPLN